MKNPERWYPTKYVREGGLLKASRNPAYVSPGSRFTVDTIAPYYERAIRTHATGRLLDMGCGHVPLFDVYRDLISDNVCIDWENTLHLNPYVDHAVDISGALPFDCESFDTVLLTDVLEHVPEPQNTVAEISRLLRPEGKLILGVPFFYGLHEIPYDYYRYTEFALRRFCQKTGLEVVELNQYGGLPEVLVDLTAKSLGFLSSRGAAVLRPLHAIASRFCSTSFSRRLSKATRAAFPLGYVMVARKKA